MNTNTKISFQTKIENFMKLYHQEERWESIYLFSSDGLLMAGYKTSSDFNEDSLLEFAFSLINVAKLLNGKIPVNEITLRGEEKKLLVFRFFSAFEDELIIAAVVSNKKGYKRALNKLIKTIRTL